MSGVKGRSGGARPGSGPKPKTAQTGLMKIEVADTELLKQQLSAGLALLSDKFGELLKKALGIALSKESTAESLRMIRFLIELPLAHISIEKEADTAARTLRERWTYEVTRPSDDTDRRGTAEPNKPGTQDAEYRVIS